MGFEGFRVGWWLGLGVVRDPFIDLYLDQPRSHVHRLGHVREEVGDAPALLDVALRVGLERVDLREGWWVVSFF